MATKRKPRTDLYGGHDPRTLPAYSIQEAAAYLAMPRSTVRTWVVGRKRADGRLSRGVIKPARREPCRLSFVNLVELHVLRSIRDAGVKLDTIRTAIRYLGQRFGVKDAPLAHQQMRTDGVTLFVDHLGVLIDVGGGVGQLAIREVILAHLDRIDRDPSGLAARLYPFPAGAKEGSRERPFSIDPRVHFGRLCLAGTGITADDIYSRWKAAESIDEIAADFDRRSEEIEQALRQFHTAA